MNYEEYLLEVKKLEKEFEKKNVELMKRFVDSNNPHKVGEKVTDHIGTILIEKIGYSWGYASNPCATYLGVELKKDGTPNKRDKKRMVWQSNVVKN